MKKILSTKYQENTWSIGLLVLRIAVGYMMLHHGLGKLNHYGDPSAFDNVKSWNMLLGAPIDGYLVIFAELFCSIFLMLGLFTRFALAPLIITMLVAFYKYHNGVVFGEKGGETALLYLFAYVGLLATGPGKFSIDRMIAK